MRRQMSIAQPLKTPATRASVHFSVLGRPTLLVTAEGGFERNVAPGGKALGLLAYLACSPKRGAPREKVAELLWSTSDPEGAFQSVRQARATLKRLVGEELVLLQDGFLTVSAAVQCDRDSFRAHIAAGRLDEAIALYRGPFCDGFAAPGADEFELWAETERASLRTYCAEALSQLANRALHEARATDALSLATHLAHVDQYDERSWRIRIEALLLKRDRFGLSVAVTECEAWSLREEIEASRSLGSLLNRARKPSPDTGDHALAAEATGLRADLIGREVQFSALLAAWKDAGRGRANCTALIGPSGFGKSRLIGDFRERLVASNARVASVRALPADRDIQFALVSRLAAALSNLRGAAGLSERSAAVLVGLNPSLSAQFPASSGLPPASAPVAYLEALDELIGVVADDARVAIMIDDLHWADADSARLIASMAERQTGRRVLLLLAMRPRDGRSPKLPENAALVLVSPLSREETDALLTSIARPPDDVDGTLWTRLHESTGGNPLLVLETLRLAMDAGALALSDGAWNLLDQDALTAVLQRQSVITNRIARLDSRTLGVARLLAVAGRPLSVHAIVDSELYSTVDSATSLHVLEARDIATRVQEGWSISHDAVADALVSAMAPEDLRQSRLQAALALRETRDHSCVRSALHLFATAGAWDECARTLVTLAKESDHVSGTAARYDVARSMMASLAPSSRTQLQQYLPMSLRYPMRRVASFAFAGLVSVIGILGAVRLSQPDADPSDAQLVFQTIDADGSAASRRIDFRLRTWAPSSPIQLSDTPASELSPGRVDQVALAPEGEPSAVQRFFPDSGGVDVALWFPDGREERLTFARGDDVPDGWAPDRSALLVESSRIGQMGHRAIFVVDARTHQARRLTSGGTRETSDGRAAWSPDGSRIAFVRTYYDIRPAEFCTVDSDARNERCRALPGVSVGGISGWLDPYRLGLATDSAGMYRTEVVRASDNAVLSRLPRDEECFYSPNGTWVACTSVANPRRVSVAPVANPQSVGVVVIPAGMEAYVLGWRPERRSRTAIATLSLSAPADAIPAGVGTRLRAEAFGLDGDRAEAAALRWSIADSSTGRISADGVVIPTHPGTITIHVTAGGWRSAEATLRVEGVSSQQILNERWDASTEQRWQFFGVPTPRLINEGGRHAFWNNGDGDHFSGAYLRQGIPSRDGVWLDSEVMSRISATQWQVIQIFINGQNREALGGWDHKTGMLPSIPSVCTFSYPEGEGYSAARNVSPAGDVSTQLGIGMDILARRGWYRIRLQVFPDGRCGLAINGTPVYISKGSAHLPDSVIAVVQGNSVGAHILVGALAMGRGIPADIPWTRLEDVAP